MPKAWDSSSVWGHVSACQESPVADAENDQDSYDYQTFSQTETVFSQQLKNMSGSVVRPHSFEPFADNFEPLKRRIGGEFFGGLTSRWS